MLRQRNGTAFIRTLPLIESDKYQDHDKFLKEVEDRLEIGEPFSVWVENGLFLVLPRLDIYIENWAGGPTESDYDMYSITGLLKTLGKEFK